MKIGIWHGYLLSGTGSNIYVQNLARALAKKGNDVVVLCQDKKAHEQDFITEFNGTHKLSPYQGKCTAYCPDIGSILPVYVKDDYAGFEVKTFLELTQGELDNYINRNVDELKKVIETEGVELLFTNHAIMSPYIASLACDSIPYYSYIHGSAMEFVVRHSEKYKDYATKGLQKAKKIFVGSSDMGDRVMAEFSESIENLEAKLELLPCGVDLSLFTLENSLTILGAELKKELGHNHGKKLNSAADSEAFTRNFYWNKNIPRQIIARQQEYDYNLPDSEITNEGLDFNPMLQTGINLVYMGKFLPTKGIQNIILALPTIIDKLGKQTNLTLIGFGKYREHLELLLTAVQEGNANKARAILETDALLSKSISELHKVEWEKGKLTKGKIYFTGKLNHHQLSKILPLCHVLIAPSIAPEAFGMVGIEGAACGLMPVTTYASGFKDITDTLKRYLTKEQAASLKASLETPIEDLARIIPEAYNLKAERNTLRKAVKDNFTWEAIADKITSSGNH